MNVADRTLFNIKLKESHKTEKTLKKVYKNNYGFHAKKIVFKDIQSAYSIQLASKNWEHQLKN
jgi:hypothetical protein